VKKRVEPNTSRIVEGLRDTGYSFDAAIADLVDNSIEADASIVEVSVYLDHENRPLVQVADNGCGMDLPALENAMRYGADKKEEQRRLGWFGLGLKTASTSFCRRLTVVSRPKESLNTYAATWDLDEVVEVNEWELEIDEANDDELDAFSEYVESLGLNDGSQTNGTVVLWRNVDRLLQKSQGGEYKDPQGALARRIVSLEWHLRMVYQRFLDPNDGRARTVEIRLNGKPLQPWDPFAENFGLEPELVKNYRVTGRDGQLGEIVLRGFILPKDHEMEDPKKFKDYVRSSGNERQGFFFYREERLIDKPGWIDPWIGDTHLRRLRIEVSFPSTLDPYFGVGLRKSGLRPHETFIALLEECVPGLRTEADTLDRKGKARRDAAESNNQPNPADGIIRNRRDEIDAPETKPIGGQGIAITNNQPDDLVVRNPDGSPNPDFRIEVINDDAAIYVSLIDSLDKGAMWEPGLRSAGGAEDFQVRINASHEWVRRAYLIHEIGSAERVALDVLLFALATAELNNTDLELQREFEQFRTEVARNLLRFSADLPEPDLDD
jgi:hypothetical protein